MRSFFTNFYIMALFVLVFWARGMGAEVHRAELRPDTSAPTAPSRLTAFASSPSRIKLTWFGSEDNVGVKGYNVYQDGSPVIQAKRTSAVSTGLKSNTKYCFSVSAVDAAGNESPKSALKCTETFPPPDKSAPSAPSGLHVSAVSTTAVDLSWSSSTDDVGVVGYNVYKDGTLLKSISGTSTIYAQATAGMTNCYAVTALDAVGNESSRSKQECVTMKSLAQRGTVWVAGENRHGEVGDGSSSNRYSFVQALGLKDVSQVATGLEHSLAIRADGTVWAWGKNSRGQLGDGTIETRFTPVKVTSLTGVKKVAAGWYHSVALKADGTVWAWGRNYFGQLGDDAILDKHTPKIVRGLSGIVEIATGWFHTMALASDGTVWAWGWNFRGQLCEGSRDNSIKPMRIERIKQVKGIAAGHYHTLLLKADGTVWSCGANNHGQLGNGTTRSHVLPVQVLALTDVLAVDAGAAHSVALTSDGSVWTWGSNSHGQLGMRGSSFKSRPVKVQGLQPARRIAAGMNHTLAISNNGTLWGWGWNLRKTADNFKPAQASTLIGLVEVKAGMHHTVVLKSRH